MSAGKSLGIAATAAVIVAVVAAVWIIDSPSQVRAYRLDSLRVRDLDDLAIKIDCFWTRESRLPINQDELAEKTSGLVGRKHLTNICRRELPTDPETGRRYSYKGIDANEFELCATFRAPSPRDAIATRYAWHARSRD